MKPRLLRFMLVVLALGRVGADHAEEAVEARPAGTLPLTLAQALDRALARSPRVGQLRALRDAADARADGARSPRRPFVDVSAAYARLSNVPELSVSAGGPLVPPVVVFPNIPNRYESRVGLSVPLYTGGRLTSAIVAAERGRDAATSDIEGGVADLLLETQLAYWSLVEARESERVLGDALASYEAHLTDVRAHADVGMAARDEVLAVQLERDRAELARRTAARDREVAQVGLTRLLDLEPGTSVEPTEPVDAPSGAVPDLEGLVRDALSRRPERASLEARLAAAEARTEEKRADRRPQVSATVGFDYANPNPRVVPLVAEWQRSWDAGFGVAFTLFDGGRAASRVAEAAAEAEAIRRQLEDFERGIRAEVTRSASDLALARDALELSALTVQAAEEEVRVSRDRYREGVARSSDLLDAETALLRAGLERTRAAVSIRVALAGLDRAAGRGRR